MITSMVIDSIKAISFIKIELDTANGKIIMQKAKYDITSEELYQTIENKHRVCLPCRIDDNIASFYVPMEWDVEAIENYTQALIDELYLLNNNMNGHKNIEQIKNSFMLEIILL